MTRLALAISLVASLVTPSALRAGPVFGSNLIVNGDAGAGAGAANDSTVARPLPGWTPTGNFTAVQYNAPGGFPLSTDPGPAVRGANFFAGGPNNASSSATQLIDLTSGAATIDAGGVKFDLAGYLGGFDGQSDNAVLTATFLNSGNASLGAATIGPVTLANRGGATGLLFRETLGTIPVGTRSINLSLEMTRTEGAYNDGYADNLSLTLVAPAAVVPEPASLAVFAAVVLVAGVRRSRRAPEGAS